MVKRETIGKVQIALGILLMIGAVAGFFVFVDIINSNVEAEMKGFERILTRYGFNSSNLANETIVILESDRFNWIINVQSIALNIIGFGIIVLILSFILILQGLANMSEVQDG